MKWNSEYFCGNRISNYGLQNGYVDYRTLAKAFDAVLCNDITRLFYSTIDGEYTEPEVINGSDYDAENDQPIEVYQYYIIDGNGEDVLKTWTDELVYYIPCLDMCVWGVTHYGTSWDYVLTDIKIDMEAE
jgi:hypothetical protein